MHNNSFFKILYFLAFIPLFISCDKEYSTVGESLIGGNNFELKNKVFSVIAYNEKINPIQSDNLPINPLGIYDNPAFGKTTASFVTQLTLATLNPTIGLNLNQVIDSVYLDVPYFIDASQTTPISNSTTGASAGNTFVLDSIYGDKLGKIKLSVYESGLYMGKKEAVSQVFYTNQNADFDAAKIEYDVNKRLNDNSNVAQNNAFFFNPKQNTLITKDADGKETARTYSAPSMRLKLNVAFFDKKILKAPSGSLANQNVFDNYFKGLYFKVEPSGTDPGSLAMINFKKGTVTIKYKEDTSVTDKTRVDKTITLNMTGNTASLLENSNPNVAYTSATISPNKDLEAEKLYVKGGEGSIAVINLFGADLYGADGITGTPNEVPDELDKIRTEGWLINEAFIVFTINTETMGKLDPLTNKPFIPEPERLYLYDYVNNSPILDYIFGFSTNSKLTTKLQYGGIIKRDATEFKRGVSYTFNITNHIRDLVKNNSANVKLGLAVTEDINNSDFSVFKNSTLKAPKASVMNPLGTILYGGNASDESKRIKLQISYTKPK